MCVRELMLLPDDLTTEDEAFTGDGPAINSANDEIDLNGRPVAEAKAAMTQWLTEQGVGRAKKQYKLNASHSGMHASAGIRLAAFAFALA